MTVEIETMKELPVPETIPPRTLRFIGHHLYRSPSNGELYWYVRSENSYEEVLREFNKDKSAIPGTLRIFEIGPLLEKTNGNA